MRLSALDAVSHTQKTKVVFKRSLNDGAWGLVAWVPAAATACPGTAEHKWEPIYEKKNSRLTRMVNYGKALVKKDVMNYGNAFVKLPDVSVGGMGGACWK